MKHFDPNKSYRAGDGEIVTNMQRCSGGWRGSAKDGSTYRWYDSSPDSWPTEIPPTFEAGKSYRMRNGDVVKIIEVDQHNPDYQLRGERPHYQCWTLAGTYWKNGKECSSDLLPGAIEDEQPEAPAPDVTLTDLTQIHSRLNRQAERIEEIAAKLADAMDSGKEQNGDIRRKVNELRGRFDGLTRELTSHRVNTADAVGANDERVDNIEKHCEAMQARIEQADRTSQLAGIDLAKRIEATTDTITRHANRISQHHDRIDVLEKAAEAMPGPYALAQRLDALEAQMTAALGITLGARPRPATPVEEALQALDGRVNNLETTQASQDEAIDQLNENSGSRLKALENYTGLDVRSAQRIRNEERRAMLDQIAEWRADGCNKATVVDSASWTGRPTPPKPTIKGGWVNVYWRNRRTGETFIGALSATKMEADMLCNQHRIACIQIPDITVGEGL